MLPWMVVPFEMEMYDEVLRLWQSCEGIGLSAADGREQIAAYLLRNPGCSFVVKANGTIAGAVLAGHDGRRGYLHHLAVAKDCRRQGIARSLVAAALAALDIPKDIALSRAATYSWRACAREFLGNLARVPRDAFAARRLSLR